MTVTETAPSQRGPRTTSPTAWSPASRRPRSYDPPNFSWPGRAATSRWSRSTRRPATSTLVRYIAVDDVGNVINPMIVDGQVHGGIAQGVAQALYEEAVYDDDGQPRQRLDDELPRPVGRRAPVVRARSRYRAEPDEPDGGQGCRRDGTDRLDAGSDERRVDGLPPFGVTTSTCRPRRSECWNAIRGSANDPRNVRLRSRAAPSTRRSASSARPTTQSCSPAGTRSSRS